MRERKITFARDAFDRADIRTLTQSVYREVAQGNPDALYRLSGHLMAVGFTVLVRGTQIRARAASSRSKYPEQLVFDLSGGPAYGIGGVAVCVHRSAYNVMYYLDQESSEELAYMEERYVDYNGAGTPHRSDEEGGVLRL